MRLRRNDFCVTGAAPPVIDFYFDFMSPYAYLAHHRLGKIADIHKIEIRLHPVDLVTVKLAVGNTGPSNRSIPPKIKHLSEDLRRWAEVYNIPLKTVTNHQSQRMSRGYFLAAAKGIGAKYVRAAFAIGWGRGSDLDSDDILAEQGEKIGGNGSDFLNQLNASTLISRYDAETQLAIDRGVFGVPTMISDDGTMWWGNDRLDWVEAHVIERINGTLPQCDNLKDLG